MIRRAGAAFLLVALAATGCRRSTTDIIAGAPDALAKEGSAQMVMTIKFSSPPSFNLEMTGEGAFEFDERRGRMTFKFPQGTASAVGEQKILFDKTLVYLQAPPCPTGALGGKAWVRYDAAKAAGADPEAATSNDPTQFLETLRGAGDVEETGKEKVRGVSTTRYKVKVDRDKALQSMSKERREQVKAVLESIGEEGITAEVWIDEDGLPRRFQMSFKAGESTQVSFDMTITMELFDYGGDVPLEIPSEDEVFAIDNPRALTGLCFSR